MAAGWWLLQADPAGQEPSAAPPVTAAGEAGQASAASAAGGETVASGFEVSPLDFSEESPDQRKVSGLEEPPDLLAVADL